MFKRTIVVCGSAASDMLVTSLRRTVSSRAPRMFAVARIFGYRQPGNGTSAFLPGSSKGSEAVHRLPVLGNARC